MKNRLSVCVILAVMWSGVGGCRTLPDSNSIPAAPDGVIAEFAIGDQDGPIFVPVVFKGIERNFVLDTGATHTFFDIAFRDDLGDPVQSGEIATAGDPIQGTLYHAPEARVGPLNLKQAETVICYDHRMISMVVGKRIDGILGMNFLKRYIVRIDFDNGKLILLDPKTLPSPLWGEVVEIHRHKMGVFLTQARILDADTAMLIDTGYNGTGTLLKKLFDYVRKAQGGRTATSLGETASGTVSSQMIRLQRLTVGSRRYSNVLVDEGNSNMLGLEFLARHVVTLDFPRERMYLKKGKHFDRVDEADMSGLHLLKVGGKVTVHSVDKDSPAQKAGIEAHDIILTVNSQSAAEMDMAAVRNLLRSGDKKKIDMTVKHGGTKKTVSFLLKKRI